MDLINILGNVLTMFLCFCQICLDVIINEVLIKNQRVHKFILQAKCEDQNVKKMLFVIQRDFSALRMEKENLSEVSTLILKRFYVQLKFLIERFSFFEYFARIRTKIRDCTRLRRAKSSQGDLD